MSGKVCKCGQVLSNTEYPNDLEWTIFDKEEINKWMNDEYYKMDEEVEFDDFWLCPKCKSAHVWISKNREHCEFRLYEYREAIENEKIDLENLREIYVMSANDKDSLKQDAIVKDIMDAHIHDHRYLVTEDEKIVYLYNVKTDLLDGKYIIKYSDDSKYDLRIKDKTINIVKTYKGIEKSFDDTGNEIPEDKEEYEDSDEDKIYYYLTVKYEEYNSNKEYNYISDDTSVKVGDRVLVDMSGELVIADVLETEYCDKFDAPYPVHKTKKIIKKVDDDFDIYDIVYYDEESGVLLDNALYMNIGNTIFELGIINYAQEDIDNWANLIVKVKNRNFNYFINEKLMTSAEIERLFNELQKLLNDELKEKEEIKFYKPDLKFDLYPKTIFDDTGNYSTIKEEHKIYDNYADLTINLTDIEGEYIGQKYVISFDREEIEKMVEYIKKVKEYKGFNE